MNHEIMHECRDLIACNALHRSGKRIGDLTGLDDLKKAAEEIVELVSADQHRDREEQMREFADVMNCLAFYAARNSFLPEVIVNYQLEKLEARFSKG